MLLMSGVQASLSPSVSTTSPLNSQGDLSSQCWTPGLGCPICTSNHSFSRQISDHVISLLLCVCFFSSFYNKHYIFITQPSPLTTVPQDHQGTSKHSLTEWAMNALLPLLERWPKGGLHFLLPGRLSLNCMTCKMGENVANKCVNKCL